MNPWPGPIPRQRDDRIAAIDGLARAVAEDCRQTIAEMVAGGWKPSEAALSYEEWLTETISEGVKRALRFWNWADE